MIKITVKIIIFKLLSKSVININKQVMVHIFLFIIPIIRVLFNYILLIQVTQTKLS
jgi:hypothetical protein